MGGKRFYRPADLNLGLADIAHEIVTAERSPLIVEWSCEDIEKYETGRNSYNLHQQPDIRKTDDPEDDDFRETDGPLEDHSNDEPDDDD